MLILICIGINLINAVYFTVKKQRTVAFVYYVSIILMAFLSLFFIESEVAIELLKGGLGEAFYGDMYYALHASDFILPPYLGIFAISVIAAIAIVLKSAENAFNYHKNKREPAKKTCEIINERVFSNTIARTNKIYLFNCVILC